MEYGWHSKLSWHSIIRLILRSRANRRDAFRVRVSRLHEAVNGEKEDTSDRIVFFDDLILDNSLVSGLF